MLTTKQRSSGIGLLELMLSLLVIVIIIFTATRYFTITSENLRVAQASEMINNLADASYKWVQGQSDFTNIDINALINTGFLPDTYNKGPWPGSAVQVSPDTTKQKVVVTISGIPVTGCQGLLEKMTKYGQNLKCIPATPVATFTGTF